MYRWHPLSRVPLGLLFCLFALTHVQADEAQTWIDAHKPLTSTAMILVPVDHKLTSQGTGFVVDRRFRLLLTNSHVVHNKDRTLAIFPAFDGLRARADRNFYLTQAPRLSGTVLQQDAKHDLALLELDSLPEGTPELPIAKESARTGDRVHTSGNPGNNARAFVYTGGSVREVTQMKITYQNQQQVESRVTQVATDQKLEPGVSGGPVINDRGELVGVVAAGAADGSMVALCIDVREVREFLVDAYRKMATAAIGRQQYSRAVELCTRALELNPQDALNYNERGVAHSFLDHYEQAIADYTAALKINGELTRTYRNRGSAHYHRGDYEKTVRDCTEALVRDPSYALAYLWRSRALDKLNRPAEAQRDRDKAYKLDATLR